jgi:hypothetical protein
MREGQVAARGTADPPLLRELAEGVRTVGFRNALARQLVMLAGVFGLGWSPLEIAVFFLLEVFLFLSLRAAAEVTVEAGSGVQAVSAPAFAWEFAKLWLVAALLIGLIVGSLGAFAVIPAFSAEARRAFLEDGIRRPTFLIGVALLAGSLVIDTALFARRVAAGRSAPERTRDDQQLRVAVATMACLTAASFGLGLAEWVGGGPQFLALAMAGTRLYVEAVPRRATKMFQPPAPAP